MQHIYLSPHFDDAALSCGGQIAQRSAAGESVVVATIFGGKPDYADLSSFARSIHARPHAGQDPVAERWQEERDALAILGARGRRGDHLDCIYRRDPAGASWLYAEQAALFGPVHPAEKSMATKLAEEIAGWSGQADEVILYGPLAIGNHVDHQITHAAARLLHSQGYTVWFYEDYPYVVRATGALEAALAAQAAPDRWQPASIALNELSLQRKIAAVSAYRSQLGVLFGSDVAAALTDFAREVAADAGAGDYAERLWRLR